MWVIASGKGGVGKTFASTSMALTLSKMGHSVIICDLDTTGANAHTALGMRPSDINIRNYFDNTKTIQEIVLPTPYPHLSYIQGFWDNWSPTDFSLDQMVQLIPDLKQLNADIVIVDLGPGAHSSNLEIYKEADERILISSPEPTSIEKTYRFIESYMCYLLRFNSEPNAYMNLIKSIRDHKKQTLVKPFSFREFVKQHEGVSLDHFESLSRHPIRLILNSTRSPQQAALGYAMRSICLKYYDVLVDNVGNIEFDNGVWQSVSGRTPAILAHPFSPLAVQFTQICKHIIDPEELRAVV